METASTDERADRAPVVVTPLRRWERERAPLPASLTPLLGRDDEVATLCDLLRAEHPRLVTLIGPGGVGKTRLALRVAEELVADFADGVVFAALAPLRDADAVVSAIAGHLGVREAADQPRIERVRASLYRQDLLLVLDNFEQVLSATTVVADLLTGCPRLKILVTSRTRLRISGEQSYPVSPLRVPERDDAPALDRLAAVPAVRLFVARAGAVRPNFALTTGNAAAVAEICRRLDGLPLAIELAAARVTVLSPADLLSRLEPSLPVLIDGARDLPARLRTMRDAIAWSYTLLSPAEQSLFRRLAVFVGSFTLDAAEAVSRESGDGSREQHESLTPDSRLPTPVSPGSVLDGIGALVDHSLVQALPDSTGEQRFGMLETVREFGIEQLADSGEGPLVRQAHLAYFQSLAERAAPELIGPESAAWLDRLEADFPNLRVAFEWALETGDAESALAITGWLRRFWIPRSHTSEGRTWANRALAIGTAPTAARASALSAAGFIAVHLGNPAQARDLYREELAIRRALGDRRGMASTLGELATIAQMLGDPPEALALDEEALAIHTEVGNQRGILVALHNIGHVAYYQGDLDRARSAWEQVLTLATDTVGPDIRCHIESNLAWLYAECDEDDRAIRLAEDAIASATRAGIAPVSTLAPLILGELFHRRGDRARGTAMLRQVLDEFVEQQFLRGQVLVLIALARTARTEGDHALAVDSLRRALALANDGSDNLDLALILDLLADEFRLRGEPAPACRLLAAADTLRERVGSGRTPRQQTSYARCRAALTTVLSPAAFAAAWDAGQATSLDEIIATVQTLDATSEVAVAAEDVSGAKDGAAVRAGLTPREIEVLRLVARHLTDKEIAAILSLSPRTVMHHVSNLLGKLGVATRREAAVWGARHGLDDRSGRNLDDGSPIA